MNRNALAGPGPMVSPPSPSGPPMGRAQQQQMSGMGGPRQPPMQAAGDPLSALEQAIQMLRAGRMNPDDFVNALLMTAQQFHTAEDRGEQVEHGAQMSMSY